MGSLLERRDRFCAPTRLVVLPSVTCPELPALSSSRGPESSHAEDYDLQPLSPMRDELSRSSGVWSRFDMKEVLGRGAVGAVYRALARNESCDEVALKIVDTADQELRAVARHEYDTLRQLDSPYIIGAREFFASDVEAVLVLDYFAGTTLTNAVARAQPKRRLKESVSRTLFSMLVNALEYMHRRGIVHRDVKPDNVLVDNDNSDLRLIDFHTARQVDEDQSDMSLAFGKAGTQLFAAPEVVTLDEPAMEANDMWAAGLCLYFMLSRRIPRGCGEPGFGSETADLEELAATTPVLFDESCWGHISEPCKDIVRRCASVDKKMRPTALEALQSDWLTGSDGFGPDGRGARLRETSPLSPNACDSSGYSAWAQDSWSSTPSTSAGAGTCSTRGSLSRTWSPDSPSPLYRVGLMQSHRLAGGDGHTTSVARARVVTADALMVLGPGASALTASESRTESPASSWSVMGAGARRITPGTAGPPRELPQAPLFTCTSHEDLKGQL